MGTLQATTGRRALTLVAGAVLIGSLSVGPALADPDPGGGGSTGSTGSSSSSGSGSSGGSTSGSSGSSSSTGSTSGTSTTGGSNSSGSNSSGSVSDTGSDTGSGTSTSSDTSSATVPDSAPAATSPDTVSRQAASTLATTDSGTSGTSAVTPSAITLPNINDSFTFPTGIPTTTDATTGNITGVLADGTKIITNAAGLVLQIIAPTTTTPGTSNPGYNDHDGYKDRDWDKDKGRWFYEKYYFHHYKWDDYYDCWYDEDSGHYWYDHRETGKVSATQVKAVPKGSADTGN